MAFKQFAISNTEYCLLFILDHLLILFHSIIAAIHPYYIKKASKSIRFTSFSSIYQAIHFTKLHFHRMETRRIELLSESIVTQASPSAFRVLNLKPPTLANWLLWFDLDKFPSQASENWLSGIPLLISFPTPQD